MYRPSFSFILHACVYVCFVIQPLAAKLNKSSSSTTMYTVNEVDLPNNNSERSGNMMASNVLRCL